MEERKNERQNDLLLLTVSQQIGQSYRRGIKEYRKVPKFWDARNLCFNLLKIQTNRPTLKMYLVKMVQME